jgi:hypothetical protein
MRSRVDLPQPDGPTTATISPGAREAVTSLTAAVAPKALLTDSKASTGFGDAGVAARESIMRAA